MAQTGANADYSSIISYFGATNPNESAIRKGHGSKKRLKSRKSSKQRSSSIGANPIEFIDNNKNSSMDKDHVTPMRVMNATSNERTFVDDVDGKTMSFSEI